jgi:arginine:pyruvate transaminase
MRFAAVTDRLAGLGGAKWAIHARARALAAAGRDIIELTIGEPDVATPPALVEAAAAAMRAGRTGYSNGQGEPALLDALAARYSRRCGRPVGREQIVCLPGTQTALYAVMRTLIDAGDEVIVGDPMYATYEGVVASAGGRVVPVALRPERGFRLDPADVAAAVTARTRAILLNTPHNPTGAVLSPATLAEIGALAAAHDLWIVSDEVYEELVHPGVAFASPFDDPALAARTVVAASISKSHAAPGFRAGWCVGPAEFAARLIPLSETMLFGSQPFIADMTAMAVAAPSPVAAGMAARFAARARLIAARLDGRAGLHVPVPEAGMFALLDIRATGLSGEAFARGLLEEAGVAVMPGESFGRGLAGWLRLALSRPEAEIELACERIIRHVAARAA